VLEDQADQRSEYVVEEGEECEKGLGYVEHILLIVRHWCRSDQDDLSDCPDRGQRKVENYIAHSYGHAHTDLHVLVGLRVDHLHQLDEWGREE